MSEAEYALGTYCGITFAGIKAASLISVKRECSKCIGRYIKYFKKRGFGFCILRQSGERVLLYVYNCEQMQSILFSREIKSFLGGFGYDYSTVEEAVSELRERMAEGDFPHEVGVFLGYPLEDVKGFIADPKNGVKLVGYWKVYKNEECKKRIFERYTRCTENIVKKLAGGTSLEQIFSFNRLQPAAQK